MNLKQPLRTFPTIISMKRIEEFEKQEEISKDYVDTQKSSLKNQQNVIEINGEFYYDDKFTLELNKVSFKNKSFNVIQGKVGSGKTTLINALQGEIKAKGTVVVVGKLGVVNQKTWIINDSIKNNIILDKPFDLKLYNKCIKISQLEEDIKLQQNQDETMIGEKGVTLSGGQKTRIELCRILYQQPDIYLLDDIFSAMDSIVSDTIYQNIKQELKDKCVILISHQSKFTKSCDQLIYLKEGKQTQPLQASIDLLENEQNQKLENTGIQQQQTTIQETNDESDDQDNQYKDLIQQETVERGKVSFKIYLKYFKYNGGIIFILTILFLTSTYITFDILSNKIIQIWSQNKENNNWIYFKFYLYAQLISLVSVLFRPLIIVLASIRMSRIIHIKLISNLLKAPLNEFFEKVPLGRILNRFGKDLYTLDGSICFTFGSMITLFFNLIGSLTLTIYIDSYIILIPVLIFCVSTFYYSYLYIQSYREMVRLETVSNSPIISQFSSLSLGINNVRTLQLQQYFKNKIIDSLSVNYNINFNIQITQAWLYQRINLLSNFIFLLTLYIQLNYINSASETGLVFIYLLMINNTIQLLVQSFMIFEGNLVSLERIQEFIDIVPENGYQIQQKGVSNNQQIDNIQIEEIEFREVSAKYQKVLVLNNLSFKIKQGEKIGIVGKTGSGKSTIFMALLRIIECCKGGIFINNIYIKNLYVKQLRQSINIILQDSFLFEGTVKSNLDSFNLYSDQKLQSLLLKCDFMSKEEDVLNYKITDNGQNLSQGEKQILNIIRAILKNASVVLIDEGTANVDYQTEQKIQSILNEYFSQSIIITIAHRLDTIDNYDKILVLKEGQVLEFDSPQNLKNNQQSEYYKMLQAYKNK